MSSLEGNAFKSNKPKDGGDHLNQQPNQTSDKLSQFAAEKVHGPEGQIIANRDVTETTKITDAALNKQTVLDLLASIKEKTVALKGYEQFDSTELTKGMNGPLYTALADGFTPEVLDKLYKTVKDC